MALLLVHVIYQAFAFLTMYYNPVASKVLSFGFLAVLALHVICSIGIVIFAHEGKKVDYPKLNRRTIRQRGSAFGILLLLLLHMNTFSLMGKAAGGPAMIGVILVEILFFGMVFLHIASSFSRALITMGWLQFRQTQQRLDRCLWVICGIGILAAAVIIIRAQLIIFGR